MQNKRFLYEKAPSLSREKGWLEDPLKEPEGGPAPV